MFFFVPELPSSHFHSAQLPCTAYHTQSVVPWFFVLLFCGNNNFRDICENKKRKKAFKQIQSCIIYTWINEQLISLNKTEGLYKRFNQFISLKQKIYIDSEMQCCRCRCKIILSVSIWEINVVTYSLAYAHQRGKTILKCSTNVMLI